MYDLIGDVHGHAPALKKLLKKMDYKEVDGVWQHPRRKVIFVGDYIDRGPAIRETLHLVKSMVEGGHAFALLGNHEYNALAYILELPNGRYLREHNAVHNKQHEQTLQQFSGYEKEWQDYLEWFYTLPLFLDLPELRAVHACWDLSHIAWLKRNGYVTMSPELLMDAHQRGSEAYQVINDTLKGKEYNIPESYSWKDKDGHERRSNRVKWWKDPLNTHLGELLFNCPPELNERMLQDKIQAVVYPQNAPPVFFGHYWLEDSYPVIQADNVVCLDYSIAKGGNLVAYRWNGEGKVNRTHFVHVNYSEYYG
jgi:hypothetical protein